MTTRLKPLVMPAIVVGSLFVLRSLDRMRLLSRPPYATVVSPSTLTGMRRDAHSQRPTSISGVSYELDATGAATFHSITGGFSGVAVTPDGRNLYIVGGPQAPELETVLIRPSRGGDGSVTVTSEGLRADGISVKRAVSVAYNTRMNRIFGPDWLDEDKYDFVAAAPTGQSGALRLLLQRELERQFRLVAHREMGPRLVYILRAAKEVAPKLGESAGAVGVRVEEGRLSLGGVPLATLATYLQHCLKMPVLDESGIAGRYDLTLEWNAGDPKSLMTAIRDQLSLELAEESRPYEVLIIDRAERPSGEQLPRLADSGAH